MAKKFNSEDLEDNYENAPKRPNLKKDKKVLKFKYK